MENTVEERVLDIQAEKRQLVSKAFQEKDKNKKAKETRTADIAKLLGREHIRSVPDESILDCPWSSSFFLWSDLCTGIPRPRGLCSST